MRIAVCISGYFNSLRDQSSLGRDGYFHLRKHVFNKARADVYLHSWDISQSSRIVETYFDHLQDFEIEPQRDFSSQLTFQGESGKIQASILSQMYSVQRAFQLLLNSKKRYDCVIRARFDLGRVNRNVTYPGSGNPAAQCINFDSSLDMKHLYMGDWPWMDLNGPPDMWFYSSQENMSHFAEIYDVISRDLHPGSEMEKWAGEHDRGATNAHKCYKWFLQKKNLWDIKKLLPLTWE